MVPISSRKLTKQSIEIMFKKIYACKIYCKNGIIFKNLNSFYICKEPKKFIEKHICPHCMKGTLCYGVE